jgi:hypothetical protein
MAAALLTLQTTLAATPKDSLFTAIVNDPFAHKADMVLMGIGIIVLLVSSKTDGMIHRVALSNTELGEATQRISLKKFEDIKIPIGATDNIIAKTITTGEPHMTPDWRYLFTPALSPEQARLNQAAGGIACSHVYPIRYASGQGALIFSFYKEPNEIGRLETDFMREYSYIVSEILEDTGLELETFLT